MLASKPPADPEIVTIYKDGDLTAAEYRCEGLDSPDDEVMEDFSIVLTTAGQFVRQASRGVAVGDPSTLSLFQMGEPYRVFHPSRAADRSVTVSLSSRLVDEICSSSTDYRPQIFSQMSLPMTIGMRLAAKRFASLTASRLSRGASEDDIQFQETLIDLVAEVFCSSDRLHNGNKSAIDATGSRHRELAFATAEFLGASFEQPLTLDAIAEQVATSKFHLSRVFKTQFGIPLHGYLTKLRLSLALQMLLTSDQSITRIATTAGFATASHFSAVFKTAFQTSPRALRNSRPLD